MTKTLIALFTTMLFNCCTVACMSFVEGFFHFLPQPLLNRMSETGEGGKIGEVDCTGPTAADDTAPVTNDPYL